jgi:TonB family protein
MDGDNQKDSMRIATALLGWFVLASVATGQTGPQPIDVDTAQKHLLNHPDPLYPPIAKAARVQGTVEVNVVIGADGKVKEEHILSGPPMLQEAALDAVRKWTFTPFKMNGGIVAVTATFEIPFQIDKPGEGPTKEQEEAAQAWFPISTQCRNALQTKSGPDSINFCKQALDLAVKAGSTNSSDQIGMMLSHQYYGHALLLAGRLNDALAEENEAVDETKRWRKDTDQEYAMPFFWRAMVEVALGQADAAFADLQIAEETHRRAIVHLPEMKQMYSQYLASILRQHAALLEQLGRTEEATKLRTEAASL